LTREDILNRFPDMFADCFDFSVPDGWLPLVAELCEKLEAIGGVEVCQLKEKFGAMRCYASGPPEAFDLIHEYESRSCHICETCGAAGEQLGGGWVYVACPEHIR
jgi:hypothetical protein